MCEQRTNMI